MATGPDQRRRRVERRQPGREAGFAGGDQLRPEARAALELLLRLGDRGHAHAAGTAAAAGQVGQGGQGAGGGAVAAHQLAIGDRPYVLAAGQAQAVAPLGR